MKYLNDDDPKRIEFEKRMKEWLHTNHKNKYCNCCGVTQKDDGTYDHDEECYWSEK